MGERPIDATVPPAAPSDRLPGYDALIRKRAEQTDEAVDYSPYRYDGSHREYLNHDAYRQYLELPKGYVDETDAYGLIEMGDLLGNERLPRFKDVAGWAYAEAGLVLTSETAISRVGLIDEARREWEESLRIGEALKSPENARWMYEDSTPYRTALNLAYVPMMKSLVVGNVMDSVRDRTLHDTLAIAQSSLVQCELAADVGAMDAAGDLMGFLHECNALVALLYLDDPRYVPLPSSARADSGYYNERQAHDIVVVNQHYGTIKKVIPLEVKATASRRDRSRYRALIVRGKMHLAVQGKHSPRHTLEAFGAVTDGTADRVQCAMVNHASLTVRHLLELYQKGRVQSDEDGGMATFHDNANVLPYYVDTKGRRR